MVEMFDLVIHTQREDFHGAEAENGEFFHCTVFLNGFKGEAHSRHHNQAIAFCLEEIAKQLKEHPDD
jgi:hypothetical protein